MPSPGLGTGDRSPSIGRWASRSTMGRDRRTSTERRPFPATITARRTASCFSGSFEGSGMSRGNLIVIGIFIALGVGGFIFRDFLSANATDLKVGDCFDEPANMESVEDVQHHPCTDEHTAEVFFTGKY